MPIQCLRVDQDARLRSRLDFFSPVAAAISHTAFRLGCFSTDNCGVAIEVKRRVDDSMVRVIWLVSSRICKRCVSSSVEKVNSTCSAL